MKITKKSLKTFVKTMLKTNDLWAVRACLKIYEFQTYDEQQSEVTRHHNAVGFSGVDAELFSSFAKQILKWEEEKKAGKTKFHSPLSPKQKDVLKARIFHYWEQIIKISDASKLAAQTEKWLLEQQAK